MDPTVELSASRRSEILQRLQEERDQRKRSVMAGEEFRIDWESLRTSATSHRKPDGSLSQSHRKVSSLASSPCFSPRSPAPSVKSVSARSQPLSPAENRCSIPASRTSFRTREMDIERIRSTVERQWTFQPNSHKLRRSLSGQIAPLDLQTSELQERWERLSTPRTKAIADREKTKRLMEEEEVRKCPFRPTISRYEVGREGRVDERLFSEAVVRAKERQRLQAMNEELEAAEYTFQPRTHAPKGGSPPIHQRLRTIADQREAELAELRARISSAESDLKTYRPRINSESAVLAHVHYIKNGISGKDVVARMETETLRTEWRKILATKEAERKEVQKCTFAPRLSDRPVTSGEAIVARVKRMIAGEDEECTFHPEVDKKSKELAQRRGRDWRQWEERMSVRDVQKHAAAAHRVNQEFKAVHTFHPLMAAGSQKMREVPARYRLDRKPQSETQSPVPSFQPQLLNKGKFPVKSVYALGEDISGNILRNAVERQSRMEKYRKLREVEEAGLCSFFPATTHSTPRNSQSPPVRGLETFFRHVDRANKLKDEQKHRENAVFKTEPRGAFNYATTPRPFDFQHGLKTDASLSSLRTSLLRSDLHSRGLSSPNLH